MFPLPVCKQVGAGREASHYTVNVFRGYGLQDNTAERIFQELYPGSRLNPMLAPKLGGNHELALGGEYPT